MRNEEIRCRLQRGEAALVRHIEKIEGEVSLAEKIYRTEVEGNRGEVDQEGWMKMKLFERNLFIYLILRASRQISNI